MSESAFVKHRSSVQARLAAPLNTTSSKDSRVRRSAGSAASAAGVQARRTNSVQPGDLWPLDRVRVAQHWSEFHTFRGRVTAVELTHVMVLIDGDAYPIRFDPAVLEREDDP